MDRSIQTRWIKSIKLLLCNVSVTGCARHGMRRSESEIGISAEFSARFSRRLAKREHYSHNSGCLTMMDCTDVLGNAPEIDRGNRSACRIHASQIEWLSEMLRLRGLSRIGAEDLYSPTFRVTHQHQTINCR